MAATPKYKQGAYWAHRERKKLGGSDQKCLDHNASYVGYNGTNVFLGAVTDAKGDWGLVSKKYFHN